MVARAFEPRICRFLTANGPSKDLFNHRSLPYQSNGFRNRIPKPSKWSVFRVTNVRSWVRAVAAICLSIAFSGRGTRNRPHTCASSWAKSRICSSYSFRIDPSHLSNCLACSASPRWRISSIPRRISPTVITLTYTPSSFVLALSKKRITPGLALSRLRASLTTLVSIKYIGIVLVLCPFEIGVPSNLRH